ncbi:hypothetical protein GCM10009664_18360 [Kitasatospora gansuensis]
MSDWVSPVRFPSVLIPAAGESFPSWLDRLAADLDVPPGQAARLLGFEPRGNTGYMKPPFFGTALTATHAGRIRAVTGLEAAELQAMQLSAFDGRVLDMTGLDLAFERSVQPVSLREWALFDSSRGCPPCLAASPVWPLWWRLGLAAVCPEHRVLLVDVCPRCEVRLQRGTGTGTRTLPTRGRSLDPRLCNARLPTRDRTAWMCDQVLGEIPASAVPRSLAESQSRVLAAVDSGQAQVGGRAVAATEYFAAFKYLTALARVCVSAADLARIPPVVAGVFGADVAERRRQRSAGSSAKLGTSPPSSAHAGALLALVEPVLAAPDQGTCRQMLQPWVGEVARQRRESGKNALLRQIPQPPCLASLIAVAAPSAPRIVGLLPALEPPHLLETRHIPHLVSEDDYAPLTAHLPDTTPVRGRRFATLALARRTGSATWKQAAEDLGLRDPNRAVYLTGALAGRIADPDAFWYDIDRTAHALTERGLIDYQARRRALAGLTTMPAGVLAPLLPPGCEPTAARLRHGAAWLWRHLTSGDIREAPAHEPTQWAGFQIASIHRSWHRFTLLETPALPQSLTAFSTELLRQKGCA